MPDHRRIRCTCCGRHRDVCGEISWEGNCLDCAKALLAENIIGIAEKTGPAYRRWLRGMAQALDRELRAMSAQNP